MQMRHLVLGVLLLVVLCYAQGAESETLEDRSYLVYTFWRDNNNNDQFYATGTDWDSRYLDVVTEKIISQCNNYVTNIDRPFKNAWHHDHDVKNQYVTKGWIYSRNVTGLTAPNPAVESCMIDVLRTTFPTDGVWDIAILVFAFGGFIVVGAAILLVVVAIVTIFAFICHYVIYPIMDCGKWLIDRVRSKRVAPDPESVLFDVDPKPEAYDGGWTQDVKKMPDWKQECDIEMPLAACVV